MPAAWAAGLVIPQRQASRAGDGAACGRYSFVLLYWLHWFFLGTKAQILTATEVLYIFKKKVEREDFTTAAAVRDDLRHLLMHRDLKKMQARA